MADELYDGVIVITGASSGIGAATALACARAGMHVAMGARRIERLKDLAGQIAQLGRQALPLHCDVNDGNAVKALCDTTFKTFGRIDVAFANAGYGLCLPVLDTTFQQQREIFDTNYFGTVRLIKAAVPYMRQTPNGLGHIFVCSSVVSELGPALHGPYAATKAAQDCLAQALRIELQPEGMFVTTVHPVGTRTEFFETSSKLSNAQATDNTPPCMMQTPEKVADCIVDAIRSPRPEVWPKPIARYGVGLMTMFPRFANWILRRHYRSQLKHQKTDESE